MKSISLFVLFLLLHLNVVGQTDFALLEQHIINTHGLLKAAFLEGNAEQQQIFARKLKKQILFTLIQEGASYYPFQKLKTHLLIIESDDKQLRIFSWDALQGGDWRKMVALAQFRGATNRVFVKELSPEESHLLDFNDVCFQSIHTLQGSKKFYLLIGTGSHGSGQHHSTVRLFYLGHNELLECEACFESNEKNWVVQYPFSQRIDILFSRGREILSVEEYDLEGNLNFQKGYKKLFWIGGKFRTVE